MTFCGIKVLIKNNTATLPPSAGAWYQGYGVYLTSGVPATDGGFDPAKQVIGNSKA